MQALVMTKTTGSQAASVIVMPSEPCRFWILAVTAALPSDPTIATSRPVRAYWIRIGQE